MRRCRRSEDLLAGRASALLDAEGAYVFTAELLEDAAKSLEELDNLPGEFVVFLEPPSLDARIVNQFALFSLMSSPTALLDAWLLERSTTFRRIHPGELEVGSARQARSGKYHRARALSGVGRTQFLAETALFHEVSAHVHGR